MNCKEFELIINDLARAQLMDALTRDDGLAHSETCAGCAARLADERSLTAGLRSLAASVRSEHAPAHVEARLRTMFGERAKASSGSSGPVAFPSEEARRGWTRWALTAAAAAALVLASLVTLHWQRRSILLPEPTHREAYLPQVLPTIEITKSNEPEGNPPSITATTEPVGDKRIISARALVRRAAERGRRIMPRADRSGVSDANKSSVAETVSGPETAGGAGEVTTDFLPLTDGSNLDPLESGQLVRVELPRSALTSFGLPMNVERANEPVTAEVLLGEDGMARAVRFVR